MYLVFPIIPWGFIRQRPQHVLSRLATAEAPVVYLAPTVSGDSLASGSSSAFGTVEPGVYHLWCRTTETVDIHNGTVTPAHRAELLESIRASLSEMDFETITYVVHHPSWVDLVVELQAIFPGRILYDCMDEHSDFPGASAEVEEQEQRLLHAADLVAASSLALLRKCRAVQPGTVLIRNAAEVEHFSTAADNGLLPHREGRPIVGYYGSIRDWFDVPLFDKLVRERPAYDFVLIGAIEPELRRRLARYDNLRIVGEVPYAELPGYAAAFDVFLIPFRLSPLTMATNPVKFYEHLALGTPVVSVALPELIEYEALCYLATEYERFPLFVDAAVEERSRPDSDKRRRQRKQLALENDWSARAAVFRQLLGVDIASSKRSQTATLRLAWSAHQSDTKDIIGGFRKEIDRLVEERDQLLQTQEIFWKGEVERVAGDFRAEIERVANDFRGEINRIGAERDDMLAQKDTDWQRRLDLDTASSKAEALRLHSERMRLEAELELARAELSKRTSHRVREGISRIVGRRAR